MNLFLQDTDQDEAGVPAEVPKEETAEGEETPAEEPEEAVV